MTDEHPRLVRQRQYVLDRAPEPRGTAAGKVRPRCAAVGHEQRVVDEGGIADHIGDRRQRMAGREQHLGRKRADREGFAFTKQPVPLRTVGGKIRPVVDRLPQILDVDDPVADRCRRSGLLPQIVRRREMIGVRMGVEDPFDAQPLLADEVEQDIGIRRCRSTGFLVESRIGSMMAQRFVAWSATTYWMAPVGLS